MYLYIVSHNVSYSIVKEDLYDIKTLNDIVLQRNYVFDENKANKYYIEKVSKQAIEYTCNVYNVFQDIANNKNINNKDFVLVMRDNLDLADNFFQRVINISRLNLVGDIVVLGDNEIKSFDNDILPINTSRKAYHRYNEKVGVYFFSKSIDVGAGMYCFLIRKSLAKTVVNTVFRDKYFFLLISEVCNISKTNPFFIYIRGILAIDNSPLLCNKLIGKKKSWLSSKLDSFNSYLLSYYRQLKITSTLDSDINKIDG